MDSDVKEAGFTIIEITIALAIGTLLIAAVFSVFISQNKAYVNQDKILEMQQNARVGLDYIMKNLQTAGYDPMDTDKFGITAYQVGTPYFPDSNTAAMTIATNAELYFTSDADEDGTIDDSDTERLGFKIDSNDLKIAYISTTTGDITSWQPLAEDFESMAVTYTYSDGNDSGTVGLPDNSAAGRNFDDIRAITISLTARTGKEDPEYTHSTFGDGYRRMTLTSTVMLRNLGL